MSTRHKYPHLSPTLTLNWKSSQDLQTRVLVGCGAREHVASTLKQLGVGRGVLLLSQPGCANEFVLPIAETLSKQGFEVHREEVADGEQAKDLIGLIKIWQVLNNSLFDRKDTIVAIGGGALSDVAGFAAATFKRGLNLVLVPTTLLAQVDAAIGGKTAINLAEAKNLAGTFFFPRAVIADPELLCTLPKRQFISGLAEIVKYALIEETISHHSEYEIGQRQLWDLLEETLSSTFAFDDSLLPGIITTCIKMKLSVVGVDPQESGLRRCLNLGHTVGHALEKVSGYQLTHGEAIAIGMARVFEFAVQRKLLDEGSKSRVFNLLQRVGLPVKVPGDINMEQIIEAMTHDKKKEGASLRLVLPKERLGLVEFQSLVQVSELVNLL